MTESRGAPIAAGAAFLLPLVLYVATLAPTVTLEDSGELITAAYHLGVAHAPGYPLWCLLVHPFTWIPWGTVAERVHLSSAVFGAATAWLVFLCAMRLLRDWRASLVAALGFAASTVHWSQSVVAEVYSLNSLLAILLLYLGLRWREERRPAWLYWLAFTLGLGMTNHYLLSLVAVPIFLWLLVIDARAVLRPRVLSIGALLFVLGFSVYVYLPIRASADPPVNVGRPTTLASTIAHIQRDVYSAETETGRASGSARDVVLHTLDAWVGTGRAFGWPLALLAVVGLFTWPRDRRDVLAATLGIALFNTLVMNAIMSAPHTPLWMFAQRVFYLPTHLMIALWLGSGALALLRRVASRGVALRRSTAVILAAGVLQSVWTSYPEAHRQNDRRGWNLALDLLDSAPENAGFLPVGDEALYPLLYARWVEGLRPDVSLVSAQYGWRQEPYSVLMSGDPLSDNLRNDLPALRDYVSFPYGVAYVLVPRSQQGEVSYASFVPLPGAPRDPPIEPTRGDNFAEAVRARYAAYHARVGARALALGHAETGLAELDRAEALDPGDAYTEVLIFQIYRDFRIRMERWRPLLERALASFDRTADPHGSRYYPLERKEIEAHLASLSPGS